MNDYPSRDLGPIFLSPSFVRAPLPCNGSLFCDPILPFPEKNRPTPFSLLYFIFDAHLTLGQHQARGANRRIFPLR